MCARVFILFGRVFLLLIVIMRIRDLSSCRLWSCVLLTTTYSVVHPGAQEGVRVCRRLASAFFVETTLGSLNHEGPARLSG